MKYIIAILISLSLFAANAQNGVRIGDSTKIAEAELDQYIDYSLLTDTEIDKIKDMNDVKAYLKLLTQVVTIKDKAKKQKGK